MKMYVGKLVINVMRVITFIERMMFSSQGDYGVIEWNRLNGIESKLIYGVQKLWETKIQNGIMNYITTMYKYRFVMICPKEDVANSFFKKGNLGRSGMVIASIACWTGQKMFKMV